MVARLIVPACLLWATLAGAQTAFYPLEDLRPGMHAVGKTVFAGNRVEEFQVEILGVLDNIGPKQSLILGKLSGGPLAETGVMQGMSGSPVYIDGRLVGAVAMAFPFAKEPIAGIRPIQDMVRVADAGRAPAVRASVNLGARDLTGVFPKTQAVQAGQTRLVDIATPVSFAGFTAATLEHFGPQLRALGLEPTQGVSGGARLDPNRLGDPATLQPGSMISVELMTGDLSVGADGTVTYIDGNRIYAFGHRFLSVGATELPFTRSAVLTLLPALSTSFKISAPQQMMGTVTQDRNTAIAGELGKKADLVPVSIGISREGRKLDGYRMQMVNDRLLSPLLIQMAVFSTIDATERTVGASSLRVTGEIEFKGAPAPVKVNNMYAADTGSAMLVSLSTAVPLAYVLQSGFDDLRLNKVDLQIESFDEKKQLQIDDVTASRREVRPGEDVQLRVVMVGENGAETVRRCVYHVPVGAPAGPLYFTVADGMTTNFTEYRQLVSMPPKSPAQIISLVNNLRANTKAYVRVWRTDPAFQLEGADFPDPPPSVALILGANQGISQTRNSKVAEMELSAGDAVISGSKTIQVEVKE